MLQRMWHLGGLQHPQPAIPVKGGWQCVYSQLWTVWVVLKKTIGFYTKINHFTFKIGIFSILSLSILFHQGWSLAPFPLAMAFDSSPPPPCRSLSSCALPHPPKPLFGTSPSHPSHFSCFPVFPGLSFGSWCLSRALSSCRALPHGGSGPC